MATYLSQQTLSIEAQTLFDIGKSIYEFYFANLNQLRLNKFKIQTWDAGWWQIRNALEEQNLAPDLFTQLKTTHNTLKEKLLPQIYTYNFL